MAFTHMVGTTYRTDAGTVVNVSENIVGSNSGVDIDAVVLPGVETMYDVMICPDKVQSMVLFANQPMTIKTNDSVAPLDTITLKASVPLVWTLNSWWPIPFRLDTDVVKLFLTNNGPAQAVVQIRVLAI